MSSIASFAEEHPGITLGMTTAAALGIGVVAAEVASGAPVDGGKTLAPKSSKPFEAMGGPKITERTMDSTAALSSVVPCEDSVESDCSYTPPAGSEEEPKPDNPDSVPENDNQPKPPKQGGSGKHPDNKKPSHEWPLGFINYDQQDWPYPSTGCGPDALAMTGATMKGNRHITPGTVTDAISPQWYSPGNTGTSPGAFFEMGKRWDLKVKGFDGASRFQQAKKALLNGGLVIVHALPGSGHFTQAGHYMVLKRFKNGLFRIADPNGRGYSGDSESRGWSASSLKRKGIGKLWTFTYKK